MLNMVRLSGSAVFQRLMPNLSWLGLVRILATFGSDAVAACTIAFRVVMFALLPAWGLSNAAATLVGQNLGAGKPDRAETSVWRACFYNMRLPRRSSDSCSSCCPCRSSPRSPTIPAVAGQCGARAADHQRGFPFYAYAMVLTQSFNGAGDTVTPTIINLFCFWLWELPIAYVLAHVGGFGPSGVFWSIAIAYSTMAVVSAVLFRRGRWKLKKV